MLWMCCGGVALEGVESREGCAVEELRSHMRSGQQRRGEGRGLVLAHGYALGARRRDWDGDASGDRDGRGVGLGLDWESVGQIGLG